MEDMNVDVAGVIVGFALRSGDERDVINLARTCRSMRRTLLPWLCRGASVPTRQCLRFLKAAHEVGDVQVVNKIRRRMPITLWDLPVSDVLQRCWRCSCGKAATEQQLKACMFGENGDEVPFGEARRAVYRLALEKEYEERVCTDSAPTVGTISVTLRPHPRISEDTESQDGERDEDASQPDSGEIDSQRCSGLKYKVSFPTSWLVDGESKAIRLLTEMGHVFYIQGSEAPDRLLSPGLTDPPSWVVYAPDQHVIYEFIPYVKVRERVVLGCLAELERGRNEGCSLQEISESLVALYKPQEVAASLDRLMYEGFTFNTIDDVHYRSTVFSWSPPVTLS